VEGWDVGLLEEGVEVGVRYLVGPDVGWLVGIDGCAVGAPDGCDEGCELGCELGLDEGCELGCELGCDEGCELGREVG